MTSLIPRLELHELEITPYSSPIVNGHPTLTGDEVIWNMILKSTQVTDVTPLNKSNYSISTPVQVSPENPKLFEVMVTNLTDPKFKIGSVSTLKYFKHDLNILDNVKFRHGVVGASLVNMLELLSSLLKTKLTVDDVIEDECYEEDGYWYLKAKDDSYYFVAGTEARVWNRSGWDRIVDFLPDRNLGQFTIPLEDRSKSGIDIFNSNIIRSNTSKGLIKPIPIDRLLIGEYGEESEGTSYFTLDRKENEKIIGPETYLYKKSSLIDLIDKDYVEGETTYMNLDNLEDGTIYSNLDKINSFFGINLGEDDIENAEVKEWRAQTFTLVPKDNHLLFNSDFNFVLSRSASVKNIFTNVDLPGFTDDGLPKLDRRYGIKLEKAQLGDGEEHTFVSWDEVVDRSFVKEIYIQYRPIGSRNTTWLEDKIIWPTNGVYGVNNGISRVYKRHSGKELRIAHHDGNRIFYSKVIKTGWIKDLVPPHHGTIEMVDYSIVNASTGRAENYLIWEGLNVYVETANLNYTIEDSMSKEVIGSGKTGNGGDILINVTSSMLDRFIILSCEIDGIRLFSNSLYIENRYVDKPIVINNGLLKNATLSTILNNPTDPQSIEFINNGFIMGTGGTLSSTNGRVALSVGNIPTDIEIKLTNTNVIAGGGGAASNGWGGDGVVTTRPILIENRGTIAGGGEGGSGGRSGIGGGGGAGGFGGQGGAGGGGSGSGMGGGVLSDGTYYNATSGSNGSSATTGGGGGGGSVLSSGGSGSRVTANGKVGYGGGSGGIGGGGGGAGNWSGGGYQATITYSGGSGGRAGAAGGTAASAANGGGGLGGGSRGGYAVRKNGHLVTFIKNGTIYGTIG